MNHSNSRAESGGFCEARRDVDGRREGGRRLIEAGLNEAAVGVALWAEYLGALAATAIAFRDPVWQGAPVESGSGYVWAGIGVGRTPDVIGRAVIDG
jgi:hypothetical protein